jgi:hypothetical protein
MPFEEEIASMKENLVSAQLHFHAAMRARIRGSETDSEPRN